MLQRYTTFILNVTTIVKLQAAECFVLTTVCRPVAKVDHLLDALQNYSAVNCFENSITKVILCLKA